MPTQVGYDDNVALAQYGTTATTNINGNPSSSDVARWVPSLLSSPVLTCGSSTSLFFWVKARAVVGNGTAANPYQGSGCWDYYTRIPGATAGAVFMNISGSLQRITCTFEGFSAAIPSASCLAVWNGASMTDPPSLQPYWLRSSVSGLPAYQALCDFTTQGNEFLSLSLSLCVCLSSLLVSLCLSLSLSVALCLSLSQAHFCR